MQPNEIARREAAVDRPAAEPDGAAPTPTEAPQSGMKILLNIFLYMLLLPTVILLLARFLIE
jgi:hypothetical protein